jgi:hypothetical protein
MKTPKFDAFVNKFIKAGVKVKVEIHSKPKGAFYAMEKNATAVEGEYANYCIANAWVTDTGMEHLEKNTKMVTRLLKRA